MDLKRAWRNGFLVSLVIALPLSDLHYFQNDGFGVNGSSGNKTTQQAKNCVPDHDCAVAPDGDDLVLIRPSEVAAEGEAGKFSLPANDSAGVWLASNDSGQAGMRDAVNRYSPQEILRSFHPSFEDNPNLSEDIQQLVDTDIETVALQPFGFGESSSYVPGHGGRYTPAMFATGGNTGSASGLQKNLDEPDETPFNEQLPESASQIEFTEPNDTPVSGGSGTDNNAIQSVPEPSSLVLMTIGTMSVAALLNRRKSNSPEIHS